MYIYLIKMSLNMKAFLSKNWMYNMQKCCNHSTVAYEPISIWTTPMKRVFVPRTANQKKYVEYLQNANVNMIVGYGTTGTGKSLFATQNALQGLIDGCVKKVVFINSISDNQPTYQSLLRFYSAHSLYTLIHSGLVEIIPISNIVGRTFHNSWIVACNIHNVSPDNMKTLVTRVGQNTRIVLTGDVKTNNVTVQNGFMDFVNRLHRHKPVGVELIEMQYEDIMRSTFLSRVLEIYEPVDDQSREQIEANICELERNNELESSIDDYEEVKRDKV